MPETGFERARRALREMIEETTDWEAQHKHHGRTIEMWVCKVRQKGLLDLQKKMDAIAKELGI